jgi:hypothetical protein
MNKNYDVGVASKSTTFTSNFVKIGPFVRNLNDSPPKHKIIISKG